MSAFHCNNDPSKLWKCKRCGYGYNVDAEKKCIACSTKRPIPKEGSKQTTPIPPVPGPVENEVKAAEMVDIDLDPNQNESDQPFSINYQFIVNSHSSQSELQPIKSTSSSFTAQNTLLDVKNAILEQESSQFKEVTMDMCDIKMEIDGIDKNKDNDNDSMTRDEMILGDIGIDGLTYEKVVIKVLININNVKENETTKAISKIVEENKEIPQIRESGLDSVIKCLQNYTENEDLESTDNKNDSDNNNNNDTEYQRKLEDRKVLIESVKWQQKLYKNNENAIKEVKTIESNLEKESNVSKEKHENFIDVNEAEKCTKEILSNVNGNLSDKNTLFQMIAQLSPGAMFYDPKKATSFANSNNNGDEKANEQPNIVLKLSTVPGLDIDENSSNNNNKQDAIKAQKQLISEMKYTLDKKDTNHPILEKTRKSLAEAYGVDIESVIITNVYYGSCCFEYTISQSKKHGNILTDPNITANLKAKFQYFQSNKIHPSMFDAFNVNDFDLRGNKNFSSSSTFQIGPPNKKQAYIQPSGWTRYGLNVLGRYKDGDAWLHPFNTDKSWYRAYHGVKGVQGEDMSVAKIIKDNGFLPGKGQGYENSTDIEGRKVGKGVYCTPDINLAANSYGGNITLKMSNGTTKQFKMVFQVCVNPKDIRIVKGSEKYWIAPNEVGLVGTNNTVKDNIRPYGILLKPV